MRNAGVTAITKNLWEEFGPRGINVVSIHPRPTCTERTHPRAAARIGQSNTIGRIVDASEIAWLVTMLAFGKSAAINRKTIEAGGGTPVTTAY